MAASVVVCLWHLIANAKVLVDGSALMGVNVCIFSIKLLALGR